MQTLAMLCKAGIGFLLSMCVSPSKKYGEDIGVTQWECVVVEAKSD